MRQEEERKIATLRRDEEYRLFEGSKFSRPSATTFHSDGDNNIDTYEDGNRADEENYEDQEQDKDYDDAGDVDVDVNVALNTNQRANNYNNNYNIPYDCLKDNDIVRCMRATYNDHHQGRNDVTDDGKMPDVR